MKQTLCLALLALGLLLPAACTAPPPPAAQLAPTPAAPRQLTLYSWAEYMPQSVLDAFTAETGATVVYRTYDSQDEAAAAIRSGAVPFDVAVVAYDQVPALIEAGALARLDKANLPNFQNVGHDFRNLFFDPANEYTAPYLWGTTGLLVRTDLARRPITRWRDLWEMAPGEVLARPIPDELLRASLLALGYDLNTGDPQQLEAALQHLLLLKPALRFVPVDTEDALRPLLAGEAIVMIGWNGDALTAREQNPAIAYVMPAEGALAWVDNFVVSAQTVDQPLAEAFIDFILRPEISAEITEAYYYPSTNAAASAFVNPDLRADPLLFPPDEEISRAVFYLPQPSEVKNCMQTSGSDSSRRLEALGRFWRAATLLSLLLCWLAACTPVGAPMRPPARAPATTITVYNWADYLPQPVIDAFQAETGIRVEPVTYATQEDAIAQLRAGAVYDLVVLTAEYIPDLIAAGLVAPLPAASVPNRKNIPANFRDLALDPGNRYAIPYQWGTTGLLVRTDLVDKLPTTWADLWDPAYEGKVAVWPLQASLLPIALKKLGYSINSEDPAQVAAAIRELEQLREQSFWIGNDNATVVPVLAAGDAVLAYGWAYDALLAAEQGLPVEYILPEGEGILWADFWLIPTASRHQEEAALFLDFLLRPEIGAQLVAESHYPVANEAALHYIDPALLANPILYPPAEVLIGAELAQPLSEAGRTLRDAAWNRFMAEE